MRILHLTSHLNVGGVAYSMLAVARGLMLRKHSVVVASGEGSLAGEFEAAGISRWPVPLNTSSEFSPQAFKACGQLAGHLARQPVDIIHAHTRTAQVAAHRLSRRFNVPYVVTWHGFFRPNLGRWFFPCLGDRTIAISGPVKTHLIRAFKVPENRIRLIPHGIDPALFDQVPVAALQKLRSQFQLPEEAPVVGTVARLVAAKGVDQLIRSLPLIRKHVPKAHLLVVGDGEEKAHLQELAGDSGCADFVHFAGTLPGTGPALSLMDVFVFLPAVQEGFGLVLLEAMASARAIVSVYRGIGSTWLLDQLPMVKTVKPEDPSALAAAVAEYLQDKQQARAAGEAARALLKERFSLDRMLDAVESVYRELVPT